MTNFVGGTGDDTFNGGADGDTAQGNGGNDTLNGNDGADLLEGDSGADMLVGGGGNDTLYSSLPLGDYIAPYYGGSYVTPVLDHESDVDILSGGAGNDVLSAGYGDNVDGGAGTDRLFISFQGASAGVIFDMDLASQAAGSMNIKNVESAAWIEGSEFNDNLADRWGGLFNGSATLSGMGGDDHLVAGHFTASLYGGDGNDIVDGRKSIDLQYVDGGAGNDTLYTSTRTVAGADGGDGDDAIYGINQTNGGAGNDTIVMQSSGYMATVHGGDGNDRIDGSDMWSGSLYGDAGKDNLRGSVRDDMMYGGAGNDTITGGTNATDTSGDVAVYSGRLSDYVVTEDATTHLIRLIDLRAGSPDGTDRLDHTIEALKFSDVTYLIDVVIAGTGSGIADFVGGNGNDSFVGSEGVNTAKGSGGNDTMYGYGGADVLEGDAGGDVLDGGTGDDRIYSVGPLNLSDVASSLDRGTETDSLKGGSGGDVLSAGYGDNIDGGAGDDTLFISFQGASVGVTFDLTLTSQMIGGGVIKNVDSAGWIEGSEFDDVITAAGGASYSITAPVFGRGGNDHLVAGYYTGSLSGDEGDDVLDGRGSQHIYNADGGVGNDTLYMGNGTENANGGDGNDLIYAGCQIFGGAGDDTILVGSSYYGQSVHGGDGDDDITAPANGLSKQPLYGDGGNDILRGADANDTMDGGAGNDTLAGGAGNDTMVGGAGDDNYIVDTAGDVVTEMAAEGTDLVSSSVTFTLGDNLENLTLSGTAAVNATGNGLDNTLTGNSSNNRIDGGAGGDWMIGGAGDDTYFVDSSRDMVKEIAGEGTDLINSSDSCYLAAYVENLTLTGSGNIAGTGNSYANILIGNTGGNRLDGGAGNDTMIGGAGNDIYIWELGDTITELADEGYDMVVAGISFTLADNFEGLALTGSAAVDGIGNSLDNRLSGNSGNNRLDGGAGNDSLSGDLGNDTMIGGTGDDMCGVDSSGDVVTEAAGEGTDWVMSSISFNLGANFENLRLIESAPIDGTGNGLDNIIGGNAKNNRLDGAGGADTLYGVDGNDWLDGGAGNDTMTGGAGHDSYVVDSTGDVVAEAAGEGTDLVTSSISFVLGANLENLTLTGSAAIYGIGNGLSNVVRGNDGANRLDGAGGTDTLFGLGGNDWLDGGVGKDTMAGGQGDDTYVWAVGDVITELTGEGSDTVMASNNHTLGDNVENLSLTGSASLTGIGNALDNRLTGNGGANRLDGGLGFDTLAGGLGGDTYVVDSRLDIVTELSDEGTDTVLSAVDLTLADHIENLILIGASDLRGYGNAGDNTVTGNDGANLIRGLDGNDALDGGLGADAMYGGAGDDSYYVDNAGDLAREYADEGTDSVFATVGYSIAATAVENLTLLGSGDLDATGNRLANTITGNSGNNLIDGNDGTDTLIGGAGDDTYIVWRTADTVAEADGGGTDTVQAIRSYALADHVENLTLIGTGSTAGVGNGLDNVITGNSGNNRLTGGAGADTFVFLAGSGADRIWDFSASEGDRIDISAYTHGLTGGGGVTIIQSFGNTLIDLGGGNVVTVARTHANDAAFLSHIVW